MLRTIATILLLTLVSYFIMVNVFDKPTLIKTANEVPMEAELSNIDENIRVELGISNELPIEGNNNYNSGTHTRTTVGGPVGEGSGSNLTSASTFNETQQGVLPSNHDLFEKTANFDSDVTNINQFYKNNPEIFDKSVGGAYVPDVTKWDSQGQQMFNEVSQSGGGGAINPSNYKNNFTKL